MDGMLWAFSFFLFQVLQRPGFYIHYSNIFFERNI